MKRKLSQAELDQRRAASKAGGLALKNKVHPDYFKFIGQRGGRRVMFLFEMWLAENFKSDYWTETQIKTFGQLVNYIDQVRLICRERAEDYRDDVGQMVMIELWAG